MYLKSNQFKPAFYFTELRSLNKEGGELTHNKAMVYTELKLMVISQT